jgi:hypothetical protein
LFTGIKGMRRMKKKRREKKEIYRIRGHPQGVLG